MSLRGGDSMEKHLKGTRIGKIIHSNLRQKEKEFDQDFEITFLKMEGKAWDQHMADICKKDKKK